MIDDDARRRFRSRGGGPRAFAAFVAECLDAMRRSADARRMVLRPMRRTVRLTALAATVALVAARRGAPAEAAWILGAVAGGAAIAEVGVAAGALLLETPGGRPLSAPGLPNHLTAMRMALAVPLALAVARGSDSLALAFLAVAGVSDVADGILARARGPVSRWGVVMDPLADVVSNFALYAALCVRGVVPAWLLALLALRYAMLLVGSIVLFLVAGPRPPRATPAGKAAGVVQALGGAALLAAMHPALSGAVSPVQPYVVAVVGLAFGCVVVSQTIIGWRWLRSRPGSGPA